MAIDSSIRSLIGKNGHITLDDVMLEALTLHPGSYYKNLDHIGAEGDFITAPEISQFFGEMIALWTIEQWEVLGKPDQFILLELGPGSGSLMYDILRTASIVPEFMASVNVLLHDINPNFIKLQKEKLKEFKISISWLNAIHYVNRQKYRSLPIIIVANEFFDALPIKQYIKLKNIWSEIVLVVDPVDGRIKFDKIQLIDEFQKYLQFQHSNATEGAIIEESSISIDIVKFLAERVKRTQGAAIIIDYGYYIQGFNRTSLQYNSTLQAVKNHKFHPILDAIGEADITAHVDFHVLEKAVKERKINDISVLSQCDFLIKYGILIRLAQLKKSVPAEEYNILLKQVDRLINHEQMGELFKVLSFRRLKK